MKRWSKEDIQFLRDNYNKMRNKELAKILNTTENAVRFQACSHNIKKSDCITRVWNKEKDDYIRKNYQNNSNESIANALGVSYYAVSHRAKALHVRKSDDYINKLRDKYEYRKGHVPFTKGKKMSDYMSSEKIERVKSTQFKKGDPVYNHKEVGYEKLYSNGYTVVKVAEPDKFEFKHRLIWEKANGPIPDGCIITFADGNKSNFDIKNLKCISKREHMKKFGINFYPEKVKKAIFVHSKFEKMINKLLKQ